MPKGTLDRSSTALSKILKDHMQALSSEELPIRTVGDQSMFDLIEEWDSLCRERRPAIQSLIDDRAGSPLEVCASALELGVYPPPWAIQALVETIQDYMLMAVHMKTDDGSDTPVDPSQITRLESFLFDEVPNGKTVIGHFRSMDSRYAEFCLFAQFQADLSSPDGSSLNECITKYLSDRGTVEQVESFERGLRMWSNKNELNTRVYNRLKCSLAEKSRG